MMNEGNNMANILTTRRRLLKGAGLGAAVLAAPAIVRAAPAPVNFAFFVSTSPFMIAKGGGWVEEAASAKVNWIEVGSGAEINTGMAAGSMDLGFGIGSSPTAAGISQAIGYEVVAMMDNIGPAEEMTVRKSANIKTPADFKGRNVAVPFGSTSHFRLLGFLKTNNLTQRDVNVLDLRGDAMMAAWTRGDIDAGYIWSPVKSKMLAAGGEVYKTYDTLEAAGYVIADLIIARTAYSTANPTAVAGILAAYGKALDAYTKSPDDASVIVGKQAGVSAEMAKADMAEYDFVPLKTQLASAWLGAPGVQGKFAGVLKGTADFLVEQKSIRAAPDVAAFAKAINTSYLAKAVG
jgi:taurine transport system substrate-binding protein